MRIAGQFDSRGQLLDRPECGLTEVIQSSPAQTTVEGFTYFSAGQAKVDVILIICRAILHKCEPGTHGRVEETYPYHSEEGTDSTEGNLSREDTTGTLCKIQNLDHGV